MLRERLRQHVAGLGQRAFGGVDEQQHPVDHRERTLDLAAEVRVAGRVDEVDLRVPPGDRRGLGQDRDAALALLVVRVHDAIDERLVGAEHAGGAQHRVDERGLPMVDVGDERDVSKAGGGIGRCLRPRRGGDGGGASRPRRRVSSSSSNSTPYLAASSAYSSSSVVVVRGDHRCRYDRRPERLRTGLLELAGFFEAPVATLLHGRAPRADATMGGPV